MRNLMGTFSLSWLLFAGNVALAATPSANGTKIPSATQIVDGQLNTWTLSGGQAYENGSLTPSASVTLILYYGGVVYQENASNNWWRWGGNGTWISTSDPRVVSASSTTIPSSAAIVDSQQSVWTLTGGVAYQNGQSTPSASVILLLFANSVVYQQNSAHNWWQWSGGSWVSTTAPVVASSDGSTVPAASSIVDSALNKWTISGGQSFKNGAATSSSGVLLLLYYGGVVYQQTSSSWSKWNGGAWAAVASDPRAPALASAAGYTTLNFNSTALGTTSGTWQQSNLNGIPGCTGAAIQNGDGSFTIGSASAPCNVVTAIKNSAGTDHWSGVTFKLGMYVKVVLSFTGSNVGAGGTSAWPAFWAQSIVHANGATQANGSPLDQWPGQAAGYEHYLEADLWEAYCGTAAESGCTSVNGTGTNTGKTTFIDWYGVYPSYSSKQSQVFWQLSGNQTWAAPHTLEIVWVPATGTGSAKGHLNSYLDGVNLNSVETWYPYSASNPPPPYIDSSAFSIGDVLDFTLVAGTGVNMPVTVHAIEVWQASTGGKKIQ